jgi:TolB-like protein
MFRKKIILVVFLALIAINAVFSQAVAIDTVLSNATEEISKRIPNGTRIAVLNITSDSVNLSDYIINELIVNLVNVGTFQVVPRSTIELQLAQGEFDFQMSGLVSDENQKRLGQFLEAGTIISGAITRDTANSYRLIVNAIHLESFTYQFSFRGSIRDDKQVKTLIAGSDFVIDTNFTAQQRAGASFLNLFFGIGSFAIQKDSAGGGFTAVVEGLGALAMITGGILFQAYDADDMIGGKYVDNPSGSGPTHVWEEGRKATLLDSYFAYPVYIGLGVYLVGAVYGIVRPLFYNRPGSQISQTDFPFSLELVSTNNQDINGFRILYNMKF